MKKTLIRKIQFESYDKCERLYSIGQFIDALVSKPNGFYKWEEIKKYWPQAEFTYNLNFYRYQVDNGGHLQCFLNSNFSQEINQSILNGLNTIKAEKSVKNFQDAISTFESLLERISSFQPTYDHNIYQEFAPFFEKVDDLFYEIEGTPDSILELNYDYIPTINNLCVLNDEQYNLELYKILSEVPDLALRKEELEQQIKDESEEEPYIVHLARTLCQNVGYVFVDITSVNHGEGIASENEVKKNFNEQRCVYIHILTDHGYCYIIFDNSETASLIKGDNHQILGSMKTLI